VLSASPDRYIGQPNNRSRAVARETQSAERLRQAGGGPLKFCYEAGPCGYGVHRTLISLGDCMVVAPSMMPRPGATGRRTTSVMPPVWQPCTAAGC
jgi:hypothetical protein